RPPRVKVVVHRLDGGLEDGESEARSLTSAGFPIYSSGDSQRARMVPTSDIKYVVFGSVDDPTLEPDPGEKSTSRKAILRFRDGEWISAYIDQGVQPDGEGIALNSQEKSALADIILRAAVGYGPLDSLLHDRSVSEIMVNGPDQVFIERRGVLTKADVRFEDENQLLETIRRMVATTGRHIDG